MSDVASVFPLVMTAAIASIVPGWDLFVGFVKTGLNLLAETTNSAGLAIIIFTIIVKLLVTPLTVRSLKSSRAMQDLQPKIKALQKRYGDDRQKVSAETMRLYQEHGVNPLASCFPMLAQIPIFIGLYQAIDGLSKAGESYFAQPFMWLPSLGGADPLHILPFVAAFFQLIQTRMSMPTGKNRPTDPQQAMMLQMMQFLPITVIVFGWSFASGPVIYWATQSIFGAVQQYFITGWGALRDWLPFLPEVTRYTPPTHEEEYDESKVIVTSSNGERKSPQGGGLWGLINRQVQKIEEQQRHAPDNGRDVPAPRGKDGVAATAAAAGDKRKPRQGAQVVANERATAVEDAPARRSARIVYTNAAQAPGKGRQPAPDPHGEATDVAEGAATQGPSSGGSRRGRNRR